MPEYPDSIFDVYLLPNACEVQFSEERGWSARGKVSLCSSKYIYFDEYIQSKGCSNEPTFLVNSAVRCVHIRNVRASNATHNNH